MLIIIGLTATIVITSIPNTPPPGIGETQRLAARLKLAANEAILSGKVVGLRVRTDGYGFEVRERGRWRPLTRDDGLPSRRFPDDMSTLLRVNELVIDLEAANETPDVGPPPPPQLWFDPTGVVTPFTLTLDAPDGAFIIEVDPTGEINWSGGRNG